MRLNGGVIGKAATEGMFGLPEHFVKTQDKTFANNGIGWRLDKPILNLEKNRPWFIKGIVTSGEGLWLDPTGHFMYTQDAGLVHSYYLNVPWCVASAAWISSSGTMTGETSGTGIWGKADGTKMFRTGSSSDKLYEFTLDDPYRVSNDSMTPTGWNYSYTTGHSVPTGIYMDDTGTRLYTTGSGTDLIRYHTLSTAWDLSSATQVSLFSVSSQDAQPIGLFFKSDGTQMYMCGGATDKFYTYDLSTAWDITSATLTQTDVLYFPIAITGDMFFKPDGTRLYVNTTNGPTVFEFHCTTPWDISTASKPENNKWFPLGLQDVSAAGAASSTTSTQGGSFADSGNKFYITGSTSDKITRYDLSTPYEISSAVYHSQSVTLGDTSPTGIYMKEDGSKAYIIGYTNDQVREYTLTTNYDITSITETATTAAGLFTEVTPQHVDFKPDGTAFYVVGTSSDTVETFNLSTAWDLTTATAGNTFSVASEETAPYTIAFKPDGTKMYIGGSVEDGYNQYSLSTAWDVSTATAEKIVHIIKTVSPYTINFNNDGTKVTVSDTTDDYAITVDLTTAWDLGSVVPWFEESYKLDGYSNLNSLKGFAVAGDGSKFYTIDNIQDKLYQYDMSTAWEVNTASYNNVVIDFGAHGAGDETNPYFVNFSYDGYSMYTGGVTRDTIKQWTLTTAWDISTASDSGKYFQMSIATPTDMHWKPDGTKFYISNYTVDSLQQFACETAWDITTSHAVGYSMENKAHTGMDMYGMFINNDGTKLYVGDDNTDKIYEADLKIPWEIGSAVWTGNSVSANPVDSMTKYVWFKPDGLKVYILGTYGRYLREYELTTAFDLSTMNSTAIASRDLGSTQPTGLYFEPDGSAFWHINNTLDCFVKTSLTNNWSIAAATSTSNTTNWNNLNGPPYTSAITDFHIGNGGNYLFAVDDGGQSTVRLHRFKMSSPYTASLTYSTTDANNPAQILNLDTLFADKIPGNKVPQPKGVFFKPDGKSFYIVNSDTSDGIYQFDLSVAWDLESTVTHKSYNVTFPWKNAGGTNYNIDMQYGFEFDGRGESIYVLNWQNTTNSSRYYRQIHKYDLNEAWDLGSGMTEDKKFQYEAGIEHGYRYSQMSLKDFTFNSLGNRMYMLDNLTGNDLKGSIFQYNLTAD